MIACIEVNIVTPVNTYNSRNCRRAKPLFVHTILPMGDMEEWVDLSVRVASPEAAQKQSKKPRGDALAYIMLH